MKARHLIYACGLALLTLGAGCGDDDEDGGGSTTVDTGLPATDTLESLDDEDAAQACRAAVQSFSTVLPASQLDKVACVFAALEAIATENGELTADDVGECKDLSEECLEAGSDSEPGEEEEEDVTDESCVGEGASAAFQGCDATVAEYERCAGAAKAKLRASLSSVSCDSLKNPTQFMRDLATLVTLGEGDLSAIADRSECKALRDKCPDFLMSTDDDDASGDEDGEGDGAEG